MRGGDRQRLENGFAVDQPLPAGGVGAEAFDDDVDREPVQPGPERGIAAKASELLPDADEDVLGQFVGVAAAGHAPDQAVNARQMNVVELFERADVAVRGLLDAIRRGRRPRRDTSVPACRTAAVERLPSGFRQHHPFRPRPPPILTALLRAHAAASRP